MKKDMEVRVIGNELQYQALLDEAKELSLVDPAEGSARWARLELISVLLEKYEASRFQLGSPDPIDAIAYRMVEMGLKQKDLGDILGSKSRASELLGRKRPLTVEMIRLLSERLRISADILVQPIRTAETVAPATDWSMFPVAEMKRRGWFGHADSASTGEQLIASFFSKMSATSAPVLLRRTLSGHGQSTDKFSLYAWLARVLLRSREERRVGIKFSAGAVTDEFLRQVAKLSRSQEGPLLAKEFLAMKGIILIIEPHLPKTKLDGAAMLDEDGTPVIGLTVRHDRIDNFWFTLLHELVHVQRHLGKQGHAFVDEFEATEGADAFETEADMVAAEAFIPRSLWKSSDAYRLKRNDAVETLANQLVIHPALVAGRIRRETGNYRILKDVVGQGQIRRLYPNIVWPKESK